VPEEYFKNNGEHTTIPYYLVDTVVHIPFGGYPGCVPYKYFMDVEHLLKILEIEKDEDQYKEYIEKIYKLKKSINNVAITSDLLLVSWWDIDDFNNTLNAVKEIGYHTIYAFMYSPRPGTKAAEIDDNIDKDEKKED